MMNRFCTAFASSVAIDLLLLTTSLQAEDTSLPTLTPEAHSTIEQGLSEFRDNKFDEAEKTFQKVTEMAPNHPMGWINLGSVEYRLGKLDEAEKSLRRALHLDPEVAQTWLTLGIVTYSKNEPEAALAALSEAVYLDSNNPRAHMEAQFNLAMIYTERTPPALELARRHYYRALALGAAADPDLEKLLKRSAQKK
jgi:Flp pilus assembly protein TadD